MKSAVKRSILKKQRWGNSMKLCDVLIFIGILIILLSVEILLCGTVSSQWGVFAGVMLGIAAIGVDFVVIGVMMME